MLNSLGNFLANSSGIYLTIAILGSVIFLIQSLLSFTGMGDHHDLDTEVLTGQDSMDAGAWDSFHLFTFRGIIAFLTFFGWSGYFWGDMGWLGFLIAVVCGVIMMFLTALMIYYLLKLQHSGTLETSDMIGKTGVVYLRIPANRDGYGQVTVSLDNRTRTINAMAENELKSGTPVKITEIINNDLFIVEPINQ